MNVKFINQIYISGLNKYSDKNQGSVIRLEGRVFVRWTCNV